MITGLHHNAQFVCLFVAVLMKMNQALAVSQGDISRQSPFRQQPLILATVSAGQQVALWQMLSYVGGKAWTGTQQACPLLTLADLWESGCTTAGLPRATNVSGYGFSHSFQRQKL